MCHLYKHSVCYAVAAVTAIIENATATDNTTLMGSCNLPIDRSNWEESQPKISLILHANLTFNDEKGEEGRSERTDEYKYKTALSDLICRNNGICDTGIGIQLTLGSKKYILNNKP